jgi:hypothetical protein
MELPRVTLEVVELVGICTCLLLMFTIRLLEGTNKRVELFSLASLLRMASENGVDSLQIMGIHLTHSRLDVSLYVV